jgi:hypothetical protein
MSKAVAAEHQETLPIIEDDIAKLAAEDAGKGVSESRDDKFYPLLSVLHNLSPQADEGGPSYIPGAKPGSIWLRNFNPPIIDGGKGVLVQPILMYTEWVTWVPREKGGGMVGRSLIRPANARCVDQAKNTWMLGENDLRETRMWVVNVFANEHPVTFIIPCQGTMNTFARQWMTVLDQQFEENGARSPVWRYLWKLTSQQRSNSKGRWYVLAFERGDKIENRNLYMNARHLFISAKAALDQGLQLAEEAPERDEDDVM